MSPRYEDDAPRQHDKKKIPLGLIAGCGLFAILIIGATIWVLINLISTVGDAANPDSGTQTSVIAPSEDNTDSGAIPDDSVDSGNNDDLAITGSDDDSDDSGSNSTESDAAQMIGSQSSADLDQSNTDNKTGTNHSENDDNIVYVTETVTAQ